MKKRNKKDQAYRGRFSRAAGIERHNERADHERKQMLKDFNGSIKVDPWAKDNEMNDFFLIRIRLIKPVLAGEYKHYIETVLGELFDGHL